MTHIYFVRHAQSDHSRGDNCTRPLTPAGMAERHQLVPVFAAIPLDAAVCSPCRRSLDTIAPVADAHGLTVRTDPRMRERDAAPGGNTRAQIAARWADFTLHEPGGETHAACQARNLDALWDVLDAPPGKHILWGTHGTALSLILHHFDPSYDAARFFRTIDWMPYVIRLDLEGRTMTGQAELFHLEKPCTGLR